MNRHEEKPIAKYVPSAYFWLENKNARKVARKKAF